MSTNNLLEQDGVQFEEDYIYRTNRSITSTPDIALTEFVANAWDAGAMNVTITIPEEGEDCPLSIEDDGTGMTDEEFRKRWMTLSYNRQKRQGKQVVFPDGVEAYKRLAYGRNGVGRHGMLCFNTTYCVETWRDGILNTYQIEISAGDHPFKIGYHSSSVKEGHGTRISTYIHTNWPDARAMTDIISARFLYDPKFIVRINGRAIDLLEQKNVHSVKEIKIGNINLHVTVIDSTKTALKSQQHGIAFWVSGRLVGQPSWNIGGYQFLDGRLKAAKRYTVIVQTDDLIDDVMPDWTGFIPSPNMKGFLGEFKVHIDEFVREIMATQIVDLQQGVINETRDELETLSRAGQRDVSRFIENITTHNPVISPDFLNSAVSAIIQIEQSKKGEYLLNQLSSLSAQDIDKLSDILDTWNVDDIAAVLGEIDKRIIVVEAISRICDDKDTDELHTLHPLVLNARWLFGAEFDSPMFVSNRALNTVVQQLFKDEEYDLGAITNPRKRPDIICLKSKTIKAVCTERVDSGSEIMKPDQILIIELKRGGFEITPEEVSQAENYVRQIRKSAVLHSAATIRAFVVGAKIGDVDEKKETSSGRIDVVTYGHLIQTAKVKLFRLQEQLNEHYNAMDDASIVEKALQQVSQTKFEV